MGIFLMVQELMSNKDKPFKERIQSAIETFIKGMFMLPLKVVGWISDLTLWLFGYEKDQSSFSIIEEMLD
jgi:hypothetical protein